MRFPQWFFIALTLFPGFVSAVSGHWKDNGNQTLTDTVTGLIWTQNDNRRDINWDDAKRYCDTLRLAGYHWRLPEIDELQAMHILSRTDSTTPCSRENPCKVSALFHLTSDEFWSATPSTNDPVDGRARAWFFEFEYGYRSQNEASNSPDERALCVTGKYKAVPGLGI